MDPCVPKLSAELKREMKAQVYEEICTVKLLDYISVCFSNRRG